MRKLEPSSAALFLLLSTAACGRSEPIEVQDDTSGSSDTYAEGEATSNDEASSSVGSESGDTNESGDTVGDGDGDSTTESGETGDGDGDTTTDTGDGDGDTTTDTGDGDGDTTTDSGDGDSGSTTTDSGDGDSSTTTDSGDGDSTSESTEGTWSGWATSESAEGTWSGWATSSDAATFTGWSGDGDGDVTASSTTAGDGDGDTDPPPCTGGILSGADAVESSGPMSQSGEYLTPSAAEEDAMADSLLAFTQGDFSGAYGWALDAGYDFCLADDYARWQPQVPEEGGAFIVVRRNTISTWAVGAPHPIQDIGTLGEAQDIFLATGARALVISGTDRCANFPPSGCDGITSACGFDDEPFRESDMAHVVEGHFHRAHEVLAGAYPTLNFVNIHGMSFEGASLSNGTLQNTSPNSLVAQMAGALQAELPGQEVSTCNSYPGANVRILRCGTQNTQGRYINGVANACNVDTNTASGRFIHLEQSPEVRMEPAAIAAAMLAASP
jgi:hypothetical protein